MRTRVISGIFLFIAAAALFYFGGPWMCAALGIISVIGLFELYRVVGIEKSMMAYFGYTASVLYYINLYFNLIAYEQFLWTLLLIMILMVYVFKFPKYDASQMMTAYFGFFYVPVMLSHIYLLRELHNGIYLVWIIIICSWACDTCAYFAGRLLGKRKMAPELSPKKTVEGAIGGLLGVFILTFIYCFIIRNVLGVSHLRIALIAGAAMLCGLASMIGDLAASAIKRGYNVKDYGNLIPGHGGILDRFDSVIMTAPILYYLILFIIKNV